MKRFINLLLVAAVVCGTASCSKYKYESVKGDPTGARIYTLDNGLKVYMIVNKDKPRIDAQIAVKVGSKNDPRETTGLAHYFEHLMFKGTEKFGTSDYAAEKPMLDQIEALFETYRQTTDEAERTALYHQIDSISYEASKIAIPNEYDKLMASIGANGTNAYTSYDVTCYVENIPSNQIDIWAEIQADRFQNCVLRGFHTELETIYEEYNMYSTQDNSNAFNALFEGLFQNHPYNTDVIGIPSHLKNPSITNVKNYHDQWYVPNNMAVVLSGDFDPKEAIKIIDKHFGQMKPNDNLPKLEFEPEKEITEPVVKTVRGLESPFVMMAWRFPGSNAPQSVLLDAFESVMNNGKAGLIDLDVNQQQKTLGMFAGSEKLADYSVFVVGGEPKPGQTLEEVRDIALAEIEKIKAGDFDEDLLASTIANLKLEYMNKMESTRAMASMAVNSFIDDVPWTDVVNRIDRISKITKDDLVAFANEYFKNNYVLVNKIQEKNPDAVKISKPQITPICTNRDNASAYLTDVQQRAAQVAPIEPSFLDYSKDMSILKAKSGIPVLYKQNVTNGTFDLQYIFETGSYADKVLPLACDYVQFLGTSSMSNEQLLKKLYSLACNVSVSCSGERTYVSVNGLAENQKEAMALLEEIVADAQQSPEALGLLKANMLQERENAKHDQRTNARRLLNYCLYGPQNPSTNILSQEELAAVTDEELLAKIHNIFSSEHQALYYGPMKAEEIVAAINETHACPETLAPIADSNPFQYQLTSENEVIIAPYDANQSIIYGISSTGEPFDASIEPIATLYNEYFGGGMNSIVFQEMREARGLAYSAWADYTTPGDLKHTTYFRDYIQTQNDKVIDALTAFNEIINNIPESEKAFDIAKENIISNLRTARTVKAAVLTSYLNAQKLGLDYDIRKDIYEKVQDFTLADVLDFQKSNVKDRKYTTAILGRESDIDMAAIGQFGKVRKVTTEEIFGY